MTTLVGWLGVDQRGPSSLYFASDSRYGFYWKKDSGEVIRTDWDRGRKLFASRTTAEMIGYCGDVYFPTFGIGQAIDILQNNIMFPKHSYASERLNILKDFFRYSFSSYPENMKQHFRIIYAARMTTGDGQDFVAGQITWSKENDWESNLFEMPKVSDVFVVIGSGKDNLDTCYKKWKGSDIGGTTRTVYSSFCDHLKSGVDPLTGGGPQLVGLYRKGSAINFGLVYENARWISGAELPLVSGINEVDWFDELFQRCDGITLKRKQGAQRHARPRGV